MTLNQVIDSFIHGTHVQQSRTHHRARLIFKASLLTGIFSFNYLWLSMFFGYDKGVDLMIFNAVGFALLPLLLRTRMSLDIVGNIYVAVGAIAVIFLTYYSGGMYSAVYTWLISIPILALLVVGRISAWVWTLVAFVTAVTFGVLEISGHDFPVEYDTSMQDAWYLNVVVGLLLILIVIAMIFEFNRSNAVKALEEQNVQLATKQDELTNLLEEKEYISNILAHDLKNPVQIIKGMTDMLEMTELSKDQSEPLEHIQESAKLVSRTIDKILSISATESQGFHIQLVKTDISSVVASSLENMRVMAKNKEIDINASISSNAFANVDGNFLKQVIDNLLSNAIKFSQPKTEINLTLETNGQTIQVSITDQGPGVSPKEISHLFEKFSTLSNKPTAGESSSGLGLSLVQRLVHLMNGDVWCESTLGKGSTFIVEIPKAS